MSISIAGRLVGAETSPFCVAEMSGNHNQSLERALEIVHAAASAGVHALKLQTYTADSMTLDIDGEGFSVADAESVWRGRTLYDLYREASTPFDWHSAIFDKCRELGLLAFSTPFDEAAVDFLETLDVPCYKIASFENTDIPLIRKVAATGKPVIMSIGMATLAEIDESVRAARDAGCRQLMLLKCTSTYPASPENSNILSIPRMRDLFGCEVGISDHTMGIGASIAAVALGATMIEKHFTLCRADGGVDSTFSLEPEEMSLLVSESRRAWQALGRVAFGPTEAEQKSLLYRRSLYVVADMKSGDAFTSSNLRAIRPGLGLAPRHIDVLLGKRVTRDIARGTPATWDMIG